jgi:hypothetical protein
MSARPARVHVDRQASERVKRGNHLAVGRSGATVSGMSVAPDLGGAVVSSLDAANPNRMVRK